MMKRIVLWAGCLSLLLWFSIVVLSHITPLRGTIVSAQNAAWTERQANALSALAKRCHALSFSAYMQCTATVSTQTRQCDVALYQTLTGGVEALNQHIISGGAFSHEDIQLKKPYILLDHTTATQLFATVECLGEAVWLDGRRYIVKGVYQYPQTPMHALSQLVSQSAMVPLSPTTTPRTLRVWMRVPEGKSVFSARELSVWMAHADTPNAPSGDPILHLRLDNIDIDATFLAQSIRFCWLLSVSILGVPFLKLLRRRALYVRNCIQKSLTQRYLPSALTENILLIINLIAWGGATVCAVILLLQWIDLSPQWASNWIPPQLSSIDAIWRHFITTTTSLYAADTISSAPRALLTTARFAAHILGILTLVNSYLLGQSIRLALAEDTHPAVRRIKALLAPPRE